MSEQKRTIALRSSSWSEAKEDKCADDSNWSRSSNRAIQACFRNLDPYEGAWEQKQWVELAPSEVSSVVKGRDGLVLEQRCLMSGQIQGF